MAYKLEGSILANGCVTVYGPSGAGKSSLVQAAVLPSLVDSDDIRMVRVDGWPEGEDPMRWMATAMFTDLRLGDLPAGVSPHEAVIVAAQRAARGSSRLMIVYLDQLEQLFYAGRTAPETDSFFACLQDLVELPLRNVRVVLSLREDYLGRFRDRLRDRRRVLDHGFRVGPMTVAELTETACLAAAAGEPSQTWSPDQMRTLMLQVRLPGQAAGDEAEAQAAYAQIVCRALFQQRAQGEAVEGDAVEAEPILLGYLETTLSDLGSRRDAAQRVLEDHLVTADGSRTLRTEKELLRVLPAADLLPILRALEGAAILHAEEHQGSRYFEIGHDWLARKVFEQRQQREAEEEQRRREAEQKRETEERLAKARRQRRTLRIIAGASIVFAAVTSVLGFLALRERDKAKVEQKLAEAARRKADWKSVEAYDERILASYLTMRSLEGHAYAMKLLQEVKYPALRRGWVSYASDAVSMNSLRATLLGHGGSFSAAIFSRDGKRVLTAGADGKARVWNADGKGESVELSGAGGEITSAVFSPDGQRVLITSESGAARVFGVDGKGKPVELNGGSGKVMSGAISPDGKRVVLGGEDKIVRIYDVDGGGSPIELKGHDKAINYVTFLPDGLHVATASDDKTVCVWTLNPKDPPLKLSGHEGPVKNLAVSADGTKIVTTSHETTARLFVIDGRTVRQQKLTGHKGEVVHAAISPDGKLVATASSDKTVLIFTIEGKDAPVALSSHTEGVTYVAFDPAGKFLASASSDKTVHISSVNGTGSPFVLEGHKTPIGSVTWSPDSKLLVTAAERDAMVWSPALPQSFASRRVEKGFFHAASLGEDSDGRGFVVAAYDDYSARLRRMDGAESVRFPRDEEASKEEPKGWVASAAFSPKSGRVATASFGKGVRVWSADGKGEPVLLSDPSKYKADVHAVAFDADGTRVVTASEDGTARVWSADGNGNPIELPGHQDWLTSAAFSPDGKLVVTASLDRTARVFRADGSGQPGGVLLRHAGAVNSAVFDDKSKRIVTASEDGDARVWDVDGKGVIPLRGRGDALLLAVFSGDGARVAASSVDGLIYVWNADGKTPPIVLKAEQRIIALTFTKDNQKLHAIRADNSPHTWMFDVEKLKTGLKDAHNDCLPVHVWTELLGESAAYAAYKHQECEHSYGRMPPWTQPMPPSLSPMATPPGGDEEKGPAPDVGAASSSGGADAGSAGEGPTKSPGVRVKVIVLPGDAEVAVDGIRASRRSGVIELTGKDNESHTVRVSSKAKYREWKVTIQGGIASPALVDLNAQPLAKAGEEKKAAKPGEGTGDALTPKSGTFE